MRGYVGKTPNTDHVHSMYVKTKEYTPSLKDGHRFKNKLLYNSVFSWLLKRQNH